MDRQNHSDSNDSWQHAEWCAVKEEQECDCQPPTPDSLANKDPAQKAEDEISEYYHLSHKGEISAAHMVPTPASVIRKAYAGPLNCPYCGSNDVTPLTAAGGCGCNEKNCKAMFFRSWVTGNSIKADEDNPRPNRQDHNDGRSDDMPAVEVSELKDKLEALLDQRKSLALLVKLCDPKHISPNEVSSLVRAMREILSGDTKDQRSG